MKQKVIRDAEGNIIHIGEWDFKPVDILGDDLDRPIPDLKRPIFENGKIVGYERKGYVKKVIGQRHENPMPAGAYEDEAEIIETPNGARYAAENYRGRRAAEYAPIKDQLDMLYHDHMNGTTTWIDHVTGVKEKIPKPQQ